MSDAIRQIRARARRKAAGLVRLEFWVPAGQRDAVRDAVAAVLATDGEPMATNVPPPASDTNQGDNAPVVQRRQRLMTDIDGLLD